MQRFKEFPRFPVSRLQGKMLANHFRPNLNRDLSKVRICKNLIVISASFLFIFTGDEGLLVLQTTINKEEGVGTASVASTFFTYGLTSLLFSSFLVKKLGSKNVQFLGLIMILPFIASNVYPTWITMLPSGVLRGIGISLLLAAQCTYFNDSSVIFHKNNRRKSKYSSSKPKRHKDSDVHEEIMTFQSNEQKVEQLSAIDLLKKTGNIPVTDRNSTMYHTDSSSIRLTAYKCMKDDLSENKLFSSERNTEITRETKGLDMKMFNDSVFPKYLKDVSGDRKGEVYLDALFENIDDVQETEKYQSNIDSTKALFFGIHGLAYHSATIWSSLISYYILETGASANHNTSSHFSCGARFCSTNKDDPNNSIEEVPDDTRHLLIGVCMACAIVAPLLILLFVDRLDKTTESVKLSWDHVFATIKYIKKKDQLLLIPFTIGASLCRGFYIADFTKSYIACAWSLSHIGLITIINGATSALSSLFSGVMIKYAGRRPVMVLCQIITIANFVFLFFWTPNAQQPYLFYLQGCIFGLMSGIFNSQTKTLYGIFFEGDEATAFSSYNLYNAIGWTLPFIYNDLLCVSVKIYIVLAISCTGLLGYLLAERSYSLRNKQTGSSK